jgi:hypothetical protein
MTAVLLIDTNQYLKLYGLAGGVTKLLRFLNEQKDHIFVPAQIVDEVLRNKVSTASLFLLTSSRK